MTAASRLPCSARFALAWTGFRRGCGRVVRDLAAAGLALACAATAPAGAQTVIEYTAGLPANAQPAAITVGPDGNLWSTDYRGNTIDRITVDGQITAFAAGLTASAGLEGIALGPDGNLWFAESTADRIGKITPAGAVTEYAAGITANAAPTYIAAGPDGNLWFTEYSGDRIGRITPGGTVTEFSAGLSPGAQPYGIALGDDGNLWFTEIHGNSIGRITPAGTITEFSAGISAGAAPWGIARGAIDGLWFTELNGNRIGFIAPDGTVTEFSAGLSPIAEPTEIALATDGTLYFAETAIDAIGRVQGNGTITEFSRGLTYLANPNGITSGPNGTIWFTSFERGGVGVYLPTTLPSPLAASVLPGARSVEIGNAATVFATMLNTGSTALGNCRIEPPNPGNLANFRLDYQTTDPATNAVTGTLDTPVTIPANGSQSFVLGFTATQAMTLPDFALTFACDAAPIADTLIGVDTVDLRFSATPIADIVALAATASNNGVVTVPFSSGADGAFALASVNVGVGGAVTVSADTGSATLPVGLTLCQTNPATGACLAPPAATLPITIAANATPTFSVFVSASAAIPFSPGASRIFVRFKDASGVSHGSTSVAVETR